MKVGVLGGTFDPVHLGHITVAEEAMKSLELSEIIMVPAGQPLLKPDRPITPAEYRLNMLRLAVAGRPHYQVSTIEIERPGPSYTVDTVNELRQGLGGQDEIFFILGWDSLEHLPEWRDPARLIRLCWLVAVPRPGYRRPGLKSLEAMIPGVSRRLVWLKKPRIDINASNIRELAARGLPLRRFVPGPVAEYIKKHKLYTSN